MKKLILLIALVVILIGLPAIVVSDTPSINSDTLDDEITTHQTETSNSSAGGTITITMYAVADE